MFIIQIKHFIHKPLNINKKLVIITLHDGAFLALATTSLLLLRTWRIGGLEVRGGWAVARVGSVGLRTRGDSVSIIAGNNITVTRRSVLSDISGVGRGWRRNVGGRGERLLSVNRVRNTWLKSTASCRRNGRVVGRNRGEHGVEGLGGQWGILTGLEHEVGDVGEELDPSVLELGGELILDSVREGS